MEAVLIVESYEGTEYNICRFSNRYYALHQADGAFDIDEFRSGNLAHPHYDGETLADVTAKVDAAQNIQPSENSETPVASHAMAEPPPFIMELDGGEDFLDYAFDGDRDKLAQALVIALKNRTENHFLVGSKQGLRLLKLAIDKLGKDCPIVDWSFDCEIPTLIGEDSYIFCPSPNTDEEWSKLDGWRKIYGKRLTTLWELTMPFAPIVSLQNKYEFNSDSFAQMCRYYCGEEFHAPALAQLDQIISFKGKSVIEFGPSDGNHTGLIVKFGAKSILCVEGRPENVVKMLAAKFAMGWNHVEIMANNFHAISEKELGRFDIAYAHGVYYHTSSPFHFMEKLCRLSNTVFVGGWCATTHHPRGENKEWVYEGETYKGQIYYEPHHFLSGIQSTSVYLEAESLRNFFQVRGFKTTDVSVESSDDVTGEFVRILAEKT